MAITNRLTEKLKRMGLTAALVGILSVSLAACGGDTNNGGATGPTVAPTAAAVDTPGSDDGSMVEQTMGLHDFRLDPSDVEVASGKIKFTVTNEGEQPHNLVVSDASGVIGRTKTFNKGEGPEVLEVDLQPGTYKLLCDVPGHEQAGMVGTLTVTER